MFMPFLRRAFVFSLLAGPAFVFGDEAPGHSLHGEAFNEGPRQAAVLMEGMPSIVFPITTTNAEAQKFFTQGVAQQHGFWYFEAERSHRQASALDPEAAMPYWGMAMANVNNDKRAKGFLAKAVERKGKASKREQLWIGTLENFYKEDKRDKKKRQGDYIKDLENIVHEFPDDVEAKAFLAWKIWDAKGDLPISSNQALDSILDQVFAANPMHPAHHYRIHLWDNDKPVRALKSDALCGQTSPGIAHMWHMPGHTFSKLNRFDDAAWQQEAATRTDHAYMMKTLLLPDRIHNYAHNEEWLIRTWNEQGRARDGIGLAKSLIENPRHPDLNNLDKASSSSSYGRTRLLETLVKWELWPELLKLNDSPLLETTKQTSHQAAKLRAMGLAQYRLGKAGDLAMTITALEALQKRAAEEAAKKPKAAATTAKNEEVRKAEPAAKPEAGKPAEKKPEAASTAAAKTDAGKKPEPGNKAEPKSDAVAEALAELNAVKLLLAKAKPEQVRAALEKAKATPKPRLIRYYLDLGDKTKAAELANTAPQDLDGSIAQAEAYVAAGKTEEAKKSFERVRDRSFAMDRDLPVQPRLDKIASTLGIQDEWRKPAPVRSDSGKRPTLDSLGPVHWSPPAAPAWSGKGKDGKPVSSQDFAGKATLLIFYVGNTCTHCMEQLRTFEGAAADFAKQGIKILALSPDSPEEAPKANKWAKSKEGFPFPLISATEDSAFRPYRAYDDFEKFPMHAIALVDGQQRLRWLDVTYKPFMDAPFLIEECKRLLALPDLGTVVTR